MYELLKSCWREIYEICWIHAVCREIWFMVYLKHMGSIFTSKGAFCNPIYLLNALYVVACIFKHDLLNCQMKGQVMKQVGREVFSTHPLDWAASLLLPRVAAQLQSAVNIGFSLVGAQDEKPAWMTAKSPVRLPETPKSQS